MSWHADYRARSYPLYPTFNEHKMFTYTIDLLGAAPFIIYGQEIAWGDLAIIGLLVLLEGVLSIDNALVLGLLAKRLPVHQRARALSYGLIGAFVFRVIAIAIHLRVMIGEPIVPSQSNGKAERTPVRDHFSQ
jgi:hypothetical protein